MLTIAICEDNKMQQNEIERYVRNVYDDESVDIDIYDSGEALIEGYRMGKKYSIILLDMQMKELDGIETAKAIKEYDKYGLIIIITSVLEYAVRGYSIDAYDFLLKPVDEKKFSQILMNASKELQARLNKSYLVKTRDRMIALRLSDLVYVESNKKKVILHTDSDVYENSENISTAEKRLQSDGFIRISRFYLVNVHHITEIGIREIIVSTGERLVYSDKYAVKIKKKYMAYMMGDM